MNIGWTRRYIVIFSLFCDTIVEIFSICIVSKTSHKLKTSKEKRNERITFLFRIIIIVFFNALEIIQTISFEKMKPTQAANGFLANFLQLKIPSFLFIFLILCKILLSPHNAFTLGITKNNASHLSLYVCLYGNKFLFYQIFYQVS